MKGLALTHEIPITSVILRAIQNIINYDFWVAFPFNAREPLVALSFECKLALLSNCMVD